MEGKQLSGRAAIVTGAGRNIGRAIVHALAHEGANVLINVRSNRAEADNVAREVQQLGAKPAVHVGDVADPNAVAAMAEAALAAFGRIDCLINNAALRAEKSFDSMSYEEWRMVMDLTLDAPFHCVKACLSALKASGAGRVVNIGGMSAHTGAKNRAHVVTAKAGLVGFTRALANDLAEFGITANCVVPGLIGTPRPKGSPEPQHHLTHSTITGERGKPEDVAGMVAFLCTPAARYITGQSVHTNGGAYFGA
jgi:3-oxoacyl-[acyl-carrier protein] reductase